jgi:(1->4)-alpha-D-glucan 1-alpha-D-glucosylmutase
MPTATYRLQFRNGLTFDRVITLIPYLKQLGISHLYASPIFAATAGSTHGYDVIDPNAIDEAIGGMKGLLRFSDALNAADMGLILDIVPNHLAASLENPWWRDIIAWGTDSPYADYFDVDWARRLTLPVLTRPLQEELRSGAGSLAADDAGCLFFNYRGSRYPLHPRTYGQALAMIGDVPPTIDALAGDAAPENGLRLHREIQHFLATVEDLDARLKEQPTVDQLVSLLDQQLWQLIPWREAASGLSYRRFFEIAGLVGVRVEQPNVFEAMHLTVLDLVRGGRVHGLRIDHIDGLADPEGYLVRLRQAVGPQTYIVVEKILERDEHLPRRWPVQGTTGYEFITAVAEVLTDPEISVLDKAWREMSPENADAEAGLRRAKEQMIDDNFCGEVRALQRLARQIAAADVAFARLPPPAIDAALREVLIAFPVYRTYGTPSGLTEEDGEILGRIFDPLLKTADGEMQPCLRFLLAVLKGESSAANTERALRFRTRMQHLTGPLLAKSLEDTFFYRYNRLIAVNEVGGDPTSVSGSVELFHSRMQQRALSQNAALTATTTHDTKRGEDARARLYSISEAPELWTRSVSRWRDMHRHLIVQLPDGRAPEPGIEWLIYQALAGVWPPQFDISDSSQLAAFRERFLPYIEKALREAKRRTFWTTPNTSYESAVKDFAAQLLSPSNQEFLRDFRDVLEPFIKVGLHNGLTQTLLKLIAPGIPDIYQGCEGFDFSLVDPDNRRPLDFDGLARLDRAEIGATSLVDGDLKFLLTKAGLGLRQSHPALFVRGAYIPLEVSGPAERHLIAFARVYEGLAVIAIAPRLVFDAVVDGTLHKPAFWHDTWIRLPEMEATYDDILGGRTLRPEASLLSAGTVFETHPVGLFASQSTS